MKGSSWQDVQRPLFWSNGLQGTPGYSLEGIWQFNIREAPFGASPTGETWGNVPRTVVMDYEGSTQLGRGARWLRSLPRRKITPAPNRFSHPASPENIYGPYVAEIGQRVLLYFTNYIFRRDPLKISGFAPDTRYQYVLFDPITGTKYPVMAFATEADGE